MKIEIALTQKSIQEAIKKLDSVKALMPKMVQEFTKEATKWITNRANDYVKQADLGEAVKSGIIGGWRFESTQNGVKAVNGYNVEKIVDGEMQTVPVAVLVEFGVGVGGQEQSHPNASQEGYEYNVESPHKTIDGYWSFPFSSVERDLPMGAIEVENGAFAVTRGAKGVWYAYNAVVDAKMEMSKVGGGEIGKLWNDVKKRYIK